jgi:glycosyltransferase involved in cell wall biosynthesis
MFTTIVQQFHENGHEVFVLAPDIKNEKTFISKEAGIDILRVKTLPIKNVPNVLKGFANLLLPYQYNNALNKFYSNIKFDLIISPTPPITLVDVTKKLKTKYNSKFYLILRDIFPQNAVDLGFMKKDGFLFNYFRRKEILLYKLADYIGCMSEGNIKYIKHHNTFTDQKNLHVLSNYQILYDIEKKPNFELRKKYKLENKFVVVFGGNMGKAQQLGNVLELAKSCQENKDVVFLLLGEGVHMNKLEQDIYRLGIINIQIQRTIPKQEYQDLIRICDIGLISLHESFTIPNIPSKTLDYFNVGLPVLASIDRATDYNEILEQAKAGYWSYAGDHQTFKSNFDKLYKNVELRKLLGANGRHYFERYLTPQIAYEVIIKVLNSSYEFKNQNN